MMTEEMMKHMPNMMSNAGHAMTTPLAKGAMMAASGFAPGRGLLGVSLLRNPLTLLVAGVAGGIAAGFLIHKYEKEVIEALSKATGMGKDFVMQQRENLNDLMAEAQEKVEGIAPVTSTVSAPAQETPAA